MSKKILIVDDSATVRQQVGMALSGAGFAVLEAVDGVDGATQLTSDGSIGLVICDVNMPRMNGIEFLDAVRADPALSRTIVFVLTTSDREEDKVAAYEHNVAGYILKSRAGEDFLEVVKLLRVYWRLVEFPPSLGATA